jgi:outer membrane receptor protein involved in Fe transport
VRGASTAQADARSEARKHFKAGMELVGQKRYADGIKELEKAYELLPHPNVVFNIAQAQAEGGSLELAIRAYKNYLSSDPADREKVTQIVKQLEERVAADKAAKEAADKAAKEAATNPSPSTKPEAPATVDTQATAGAPQGAASDGATLAIVGGRRGEDVYAETVVTASRGAESPLDAPSSTAAITRQDIELSGITRIPELLRRVAGADVMQITAGDTNVSMRGFNRRLSNQLLVLVNGRSAYNDALGNTLWESLPLDVDQIDRIEVVRGPGSALYGANAIAGVVNVITARPGEGKSGARVGFGDGLQGYGSAWITGRKGDLGYRASGGYTRYPRWSREVDPTRTDLVPGPLDPDLGAENIRMHLDASHRLPAGYELSVGGGYARGQLDIYGIGPFNDYHLRTDNAEGVVELRGPHVNARAYYTRISFEGSQGYAYAGQPLYPTRTDQNLFHTEVEYVRRFEWPASVVHDLHVGLAYRFKDIDWSYLRADTPTENHGALYLQDALSIGKYVRVVASGRLDYVPYLDTVLGSPRLSIIGKPTEKQAIRAQASTAFRQPTFLEAYLDIPVQLTVPGLELQSSVFAADQAQAKRVSPENVVSAEVGYLNQEADWLSAELNAYYNRVTDLIILSDTRPATLSTKQSGASGYNPDTGKYRAAFGGWTNQCDVFHVFGGEVGGRVNPVDGLDLFANYALQLSTQERAPGCATVDDRRTSAHKVNAGVQLRTRFGLNGEVSFHYQSEQLWTERVATIEGIVTKQFVLPDYALLNGRLGYKVGDRLEFGASVYNALADVSGPPAQQHPFGNRVGRRFMGFVSYTP